MRVLFAALALSVLSFAAGIAGDLSIAAPTPASVVLRIPPPIPAYAVRAHPLAPLTMAHAAPALAHAGITHRLRLEAIAARVKPRTMQAFAELKVDPDRAPKDDGLASAQI
jgi:hypothetical protein